MDKRVVAGEGSKVYHQVPDGVLDTDDAPITVGCGKVFSRPDVRIFKSWQTACGLGLKKCKRSGCTGNREGDERNEEQEAVGTETTKA